jgi:pantothenate kinase type III
LRLSQTPIDQNIYYSSVNSAKLDILTKLIPEKCENFINCRTFISSNTIRNFNDCMHIGSDRLFGALGAKKHTKNAILSIDCGTATTINYISTENVFVGGMIFPGYTTQKNSLLSKTAIQLDTKNSYQTTLSLSTADAIHSGIVSNTCGAIQLALEQVIQKEKNEPTVVITGGNYHYFTNKLYEMKIDHIFDPFLVLRGIVHTLPMEEQKKYFVKR